MSETLIENCYCKIKQIPLMLLFAVGTTAATSSHQSLAQGALSPSQRVAVIVPGLFNEEHPKDFKEISTYLSQLPDVTKVVILGGDEVPSTKTIQENGLSLIKTFRNIYNKNGQTPLLLLAHSKGAPQVAYAMLSDLGLAKDNIIDTAIMLNGAFGSHFAKGTASICGNPVLGLLIWGCKTPRESMAAVEDLQVPQVKATFDRAIENLGSRRAEAVDLLKNRIYYIRSYTDGKGLSPNKKIAFDLMTKFAGPNDLLVALSNQKLDEVGTVLGEPGGWVHTDPIEFKKKASDQLIQQNLVRNILNEAFGRISNLRTTQSQSSAIAIK